MNFALQRQSGGNTAGLAIVVVFHVVLGYALVNGLGRQVIDVLHKPLDVAIIEDIKLPPPPPVVKVLAQLPRLSAPPPPFVPAPEVRLETPPVQNVISTSPTPDPAPPVPAAPPVVSAPPAPIAPPAVSVALACPNHLEVRSHLPYPAQAQQMGLSGDVLLEFTVTAGGQISNVTVLKSSHRLFTSTASQAVNQLRCIGQGHDVRVRVPFAFRLEN